ncbi:hypothetical protein MMC28_009617 [Mycoblastus sanguinarius]|nr:hypothetical protein [Mycoblastus sanguinarius]
MASQDPLGCPFCNFTDYDHYFLLQHVETIHPEGDSPSPFAIQNDLGKAVEDPSQGVEGTRDSASEYIECQCGEFCLLAELESHLDMHYAEGMGLDEIKRTTADVAAPGSALYPGKASSPDMEMPPPSPQRDIVSGPSKTYPIRNAPKNRSRSTSRKGHNAVVDFINVLRRSNSPPPRKSYEVRRHEAPQRLGVRFPPVDSAMKTI